MGWIVRRDMWGRGYGTEALGAMLRHGVGELKWVRVMAGTRVDNHGSRRMMEKVGMEFLREEASTHGHMRKIFVLPGGCGRADGHRNPEQAHVLIRTGYWRVICDDAAYFGRYGP